MYMYNIRLWIMGKEVQGCALKGVIDLSSEGEVQPTVCKGWDWPPIN